MIGIPSDASMAVTRKDVDFAVYGRYRLYKPPPCTLVRKEIGRGKSGTYLSSHIPVIRRFEFLIRRSSSEHANRSGELSSLRTCCLVNMVLQYTVDRCIGSLVFAYRVMSMNSRGFSVATFAYNTNRDLLSITDETVSKHIATNLYLTKYDRHCELRRPT